MAQEFFCARFGYGYVQRLAQEADLHWPAHSCAIVESQAATAVMLGAQTPSAVEGAPPSSFGTQFGSPVGQSVSGLQ